MINETRGNLLRDNAQALVNTVNTVGVMGKGLALQFKRAYPDVFATYVAGCRAGEVKPGRIFPVAIPDGRWVLNFPTKRHWKQPSRIEDIEAGLDDLVRLVGELGLRSIAVPPLGCGNGGLAWATVRLLIVDKLQGLDVDVRLYGPETPAAEDMVPAPQKPLLDRRLAILLGALDRYINESFSLGISEARRASLLEVHKIAYFLQVVGLPLQLKFDKGRYGPYSPELDRRLAVIEGHYLIGFGDGTGGARADLKLAPGAAEAAELKLAGDEHFSHAWQRISQATLGYNYPEGMELLASVHHLAMVDGGINEPDIVATEMATWNERKRRLFPPHQIADAWEHLYQAGLFSNIERP
jgi:O-acetyl-ADP-ribose deacetylase (regulator of RNase III)